MGSNKAKGLQGSVTGVPSGRSQVRVGVVMVRGIQLPVSVVIYIFFDNNNVNMCCLYVCSLHMLSHIRLFATPWTVTRQAPLVEGILQAGILEWFGILFSRLLV